MDVKIKKLHPNAVTPKYANPGEDAGLDLVATSYECIDCRHYYGTGLSIEIPPGYVGLLFPRSSIYKYELRLCNAVGVIDSGFRGEIKFIFENDLMIPRKLIPEDTREFWDDGSTHNSYVHNVYKVGDKIGQILILSYRQINFVEVNELSKSNRNEGGFGSSGS